MKNRPFAATIPLALLLLALFVPNNSLAKVSRAVIRPSTVDDPSPIAFYNSVTRAIESANGNVTLDLREGTWLIDTFGYVATWIIPPDTQAEVTFNYNGGVLQDAKFRFTKPVIIKVPENTISGQQVENHLEEITYNTLGRVQDSQPFKVKGITKLARQVEISRSPNALLNGRPFSQPQVITKPGQPKPITSIISRIVFAKPAGGGSGLHIGLKPQTPILFSSTNFVKIGPGSSLDFDLIDYDVDERLLNGKLSLLQFSLEEGSFATESFRLNLRPGSKLNFNEVEFGRQASRSAFVDATGGFLSGTVAPKSKLTFSASDAVRTEFEFGPNTRVDLGLFRLNIKDDQTTAISIGTGSQMSIDVFDGQVAFGERGFLRVQDTTMAAVIQEGRWETNNRPVLKGRFDQFVVKRIIRGRASFNAANEINLDGGEVRSSSLVIDTTRSPVITGPWSYVSLVLAENTRFGFPEGFTLIAQPGGKIEAIDPTAPLSFEPGNPYPLGRFHVDIQFTQLENPEPPVFDLRNGRALLDVLSLPQEVAQIESSKLTGTLQEATVPFGNDGFLRLIGGDLETRLTGRFQRGKKPDLSGSLSIPNTTIASGHIAFNVASDIDITGGSMQAPNLKIRTSLSPAVTGPFDSLILNVAEKSKIGFPNGPVFTTKSGGTITATDRSAPFTLRTGAVMATGRYIVDIPFSKFLSNPANAVFALTDGKAVLPLLNAPNGSITGSRIDISGIMGYVSPELNADIFLHISDGTLSVPVFGNPSLDGTLTGQFPKMSFSKTTPESKEKLKLPFPLGERDSIANSVTLNVTLNPTDIPSTSSIHLTGSTVTITIEAPTTASVEIPPAHAEKDSDDFERWQKFFGWNCALGHYDFAFKDRTYNNIPGQLTIRMVNGKFTGELSLQIGIPEWDFDKCTSDAAITFGLGAAAGALLCGPNCAVAGAISTDALAKAYVVKYTTEELQKRIGNATVRIP